MPISPLDFVLLQCGTPGYYQVFVGFLLCCLQLPIIFSNELFAHYVRQPPHRCQLTPNQIRRFESSLNGLNLHRNEWYPVVEKSRPEISLASPLIDELMSLRQNATIPLFDQCNIYIDPLHHWRGTRPCSNGWDFWTPNNEVNLVTEFELVCDRQNELTYLKYGVLAATVLGALLMALLADRWGRCRTLHFSLYLFVASSLSTFFASDFLQFAVFYHLQMFFIAAIEICAFVLLLELMSTPFQLRAALIWALFRSITTLLVPVLVSVVRNWRFVQLSIAVPSIAFFTYIFVLPSSPLWLTVVKHNLAEAVRVLERFAKFNGKSLSMNQLNQHIQNLYITSLSFPTSSFPSLQEQTLHSQKSTLTIQNLNFYSRTAKKVKISSPGSTLRLHLVVLFIAFFVCALFDSPVVARHSQILHQNESVNSVYNVFLQIGILLLVYQLSVWSRSSRMVFSGLLTLQGGLVVAAVVMREHLKWRAVKNDFNYDQRLLLLPPLMVCLGRALSVSSLALAWFFAGKTLPTRIRATGVAFCYFWLRTAHLAVPHLLDLSDRLSHHQVLFAVGALSVVAGTLSLTFPNVDRRPLPNSIDDLVQPSKQSPTDSVIVKRYPSYSDLKNAESERSQKSNLTLVNRNRSEPLNVYVFGQDVESEDTNRRELEVSQTEVKRLRSVGTSPVTSVSNVFEATNSRKSSGNVSSSPSESDRSSNEPATGVSRTSLGERPSISRVVMTVNRPQPTANDVDGDVYAIELEPELTSLEDSPTARAMLQGFTYTPHQLDSPTAAGPIFTSRH